jgi:hypothetical protein
MCAKSIRAEGEVMPTIIMTSVGKLKPNPRNARTHSKKQIRQIANSIVKFGFVSPILADENAMILAGHGRLSASLELDLKEIPVITASGLTDAQKRALMLADNKIASNAGWDREKLAIEIPELSHLLEIEKNDPNDQFELVSDVAISQPGDIWILGNHRLSCPATRSRSKGHSAMTTERAPR